MSSVSRYFFLLMEVNDLVLYLNDPGISASVVGVRYEPAIPKWRPRSRDRVSGHDNNSAGIGKTFIHTKVLVRILGEVLSSRPPMF
ncbi:MAG: hypothetical protein R2758_05925 [Bacteroidales bacterium]